MATVNGTNYAKAIDPSSDNILAGGTYGGRVRVAIDTYTFATTASGTVVNIARLPAGAIVLGIRITNAAGLGSGVTLAIGHGAAGAEFLAATAATSAGNIDSNLEGKYVIGTASDDKDIIVTTGGAQATGTIVTHVFYTTD